MKVWWTWLGLFALATSTNADVDSDKGDCKPEQVHIAYGDTASEMVVMWSTLKECSTDVQYGPEPWGSMSHVSGKAKLIPGATSKVPYQHRAVLQGLKANTTYYYIPVSNTISSNVFFFKTPPQGNDWQPEFLMFGDLGLHSESLPNLTMEAMKGYAAVIHAGDIAYDLPDTVQTGPYAGENVGDRFMGVIQQMASHVPYMTAPGNHETENGTFNQYRYRFSAPNTEWPVPLDRMFYSMDIGPVHFISYNTEVFFVDNGTHVEAQRAWIQKDLEKANKNRNSCPWVVAFGHKPLYCSNGDGEDCTKPDSLVRAGLEELFYEGGVDVVVQGHEHNYERLWPVYRDQTLADNYTDPQAPVQIITGAAGSRWGPGVVNMSIHEPWTAFRLGNESFNSVGRLKVYNHTHVYWDQVSMVTGEVLDSIWISQHWHGPFSRPRTDQNKDNGDIEPTEPSKPDADGDSLTERVSKAIKGLDVKVVVGVTTGLFVVVLLLVIFMIIKKRKRKDEYRKWDGLDSGDRSYRNLKNQDEMDEFEVETEGHRSLIES